MKFKEAQRVFIEALREDRFAAIHRESEPSKNLLAQALVTKEFVMQIIARTKGPEHESSPHHQDPNIEVHIFKPILGGERWYVKGYYLDQAWFVSVHKSEVAP